MHRKTLERTNAAKLLLVFAIFFELAFIVIGTLVVLFGASLSQQVMGGLLIVMAPFLAAIALACVAYVAYHTIVRPQEAKIIRESKDIFTAHPAIKIGVAGSYGKTSFKEMLATVLNEKIHVAVTPGNMNTPIAHARFAKQLKGDEQVIILEYGEESPGDIQRFIDVTTPDWAVILGLAPNHLDYYRHIDSLANDLLVLRSLGKNLLINGDSRLLQKYLNKTDNIVTSAQVGKWRITKIQSSRDGIAFVLTSKDATLHLKSQLLGRHLVVPLAMTAMIAYELGLSKKQIEAGIAKTAPFAHRMQPRMTAGALIIDDTYNGNIEGMLAGLDLLAELEATRKVYVTPGLVDQGEETESVHRTIAEKIYKVQPGIVILMDNSATKIIRAVLTELGYEGVVRVEYDPLKFYQNIDQITAAGDVVLMQNDWTDNYN